MRNVHKITAGAILLAAFTVMLLITLYVYVIGVVINLFLPIPFIMFAAKYKRKDSLVFLVASLFLSTIVGTVLAIPITLAYGLTGIIIGDCIRNKKGKHFAFVAGSITFLLNLVAQYAVAVAFFKVNFIEQSMELFKESIDQSEKIINALGQEPNEAILEQFHAGIKLMESLIPSLFVLASFGIVLLIMVVSFPIIKRFGIDVGNWEPFRNMSLPKNIMIYFFIAFVASLLFQPEVGSYLHVALSNIVFILQLLILIQGVSFIWYYSHLKEWSRAIPIIATISLFIMPLLLYIVWILGIIDLSFNLRKRLNTTV